MRRLLPLLSLLLAGCGEPVRDDHFANDVATDAPVREQAAAAAVPVRIGELGPNFDACGAAGTTRHIGAGSTLPVRVAPFDTAEQQATVAPGQRFFVCARTIDQKWFGIVYEDAGGLSESCGVSAPVASARPYQGPCRSGWVASAFVKLIAGNEVPAAPAAGAVGS